MKRSIVNSLVIALTLLALTFSAVGVNPAQAAASWNMTDLGTLGGPFSYATDINEAGQVVGMATSESGQRAFVWDSVNGMTDLGTLGGTYSEASAINEAGQVVGVSTITGDTESHAFVWDSVNGMTDLGTLGGTNSNAVDINEAGQVVGWSYTAGNVERHAFVWDSVNGMTDLGTLGGSYSYASAINEAGQVVGEARTASGNFHAFMWDSVNGMTDLGTLGGSGSGAYAINAAGQVVGEAQTAFEGDYHAFVWDSVNGMTDLGTLGGVESYAYAINEAGQVVGEAETASYDAHAFVWDSVNGMTDLGTLGGDDSYASAINAAGQVVGEARTGSGDNHAFVWDSVNGMTDLGTLGGSYSYASAINAAGQVVGQAETVADTHAFIATVTPGVIPATWVGGVGIQSDQNVVAVGRPHLGSEVASYIGSSAGGLTQYVPMLFKDAFANGSYDAALYLQNLGSVTANLSIAFIDSSGATVYTKTDTLDPHASKGYWLPAEAGLPAGFAGGAKITSDQEIVAVGRPHIGGQVMTYNGMSKGDAVARLPMFFKNGFGSYNTAIYVQNLAGSAANLQITYYNLDGTTACTDTDSLEAYASKGYWSLSVTCETGSLPSGFVGGVRVVSPLGNILTVARVHMGTQITTYNGFTGGSTSAYVPMLFKNAFGGGAYDAALYLQNIGIDSADVTIEYIDNAGAVAATQNVTLAAEAISSIWLPSVAGLPDGFVGGARISTTVPIIAIGRPHLGAEITAYNGTPAGSTSAYLPMLFKNAYTAPYQAAFYIQNVTNNPANVNIRFYDNNGLLSCIKTISLAANATQGFWMPTVSCAP